MTLQATRVLLCAYQCGPGMGSVSQIGWEWYLRLARRTPTTLVTHIRNREALEMSGAPLPGSEVIYIDTEWFAGRLWRLASKLFRRSQHAVFLISSLDFFIYDWQAVRETRRRLRRGARWDVVHAVTPVSPVAPTRFHRTGLPLVVGPLNGGLKTPAHFRELMGQDSSWIYPLRHFGKALDVFTGSTRRAAMLLTATESTRKDIPPRYRDKCVSMLENGTDLNLFRPTLWPESPSPSMPLKILFVGRLIPAKGVTMLLDAVKVVSETFPVRLEIVGDGPMRGEWEARAKGLGLGETVSFVGNRSLEEVASRLRDAHVFCLPSVRESGGAVLLEAMAAARPIVAVAYGGPGEVIDDGVGEGIKPRGPAQVTGDLVRVFYDIFRRPDDWRRRGEEGRRRAESLYGWEAKVGRMLKLYEEVICSGRRHGRTAARPEHV